MRLARRSFPARGDVASTAMTTPKPKKSALVKRIARVAGAAMKDAEIARATYHEPKFRADVKKDRRGTLSRYKTVQHALRDRAAPDAGATGKAAKKPR